MDDKLQREILQRLTQLEILQRVNNVLLSKFILQLQVLRKELHLPKLISFWKFDLAEDDYKELVSEYDKKDVDNALYYLSRLLVDNKIDCPNNIKKYIIKQLKKQKLNREYYNDKKKEKPK